MPNIRFTRRPVTACRSAARRQGCPRWRSARVNSSVGRLRIVWCQIRHRHYSEPQWVAIMIFAFATDDRGLMTYADEAEAVAYAEGIDVEEGGWRFFAADGAELEAVFSTPNSRGSFT